MKGFNLGDIVVLKREIFNTPGIPFNESMIYGDGQYYGVLSRCEFKIEAILFDRETRRWKFHCIIANAPSSYSFEDPWNVTLLEKDCDHLDNSKSNKAIALEYRRGHSSATEYKETIKTPEPTKVVMTIQEYLDEYDKKG